MANPVTIYIHHQSYRFLAEEEETYLQQCADIVNKEMDQAMAGNTLSITDGAVLAAMNVADKYCKERQVSDNLRAQLKQALDENTRLARELAEAKREARKAAGGRRGQGPQTGPPTGGDLMELLAPAGSPEALTAAVQAGADAVYLGFGPLNARRNAKNFTREELEAGWPTAICGG